MIMTTLPGRPRKKLKLDQLIRATNAAPQAERALQEHNQSVW